MTDETPKPQRTKTCPQCGETRVHTHFPKDKPLCGICLGANAQKDLQEKMLALAERKEELKKARNRRKAAAYKRKVRRKASKAEQAEKARAKRKAETAVQKQIKRKMDKDRAIEAARKEAVAKQEVAKEVLVRRELASRALARKHLMPYIMRAHPGYLAGWVHKDVAMRLERFSQQVADGLSPRLMIQMPPRTGKSQEASIHYPAWHLGNYPHHEFITCSYSGSLAMGFSRKVRGALRDPDHKLLFPACTLDPDNQNAEGWMTTKGGGFTPAGVGGPITGKGAHILLIDDPVKNAEEAESQTVRQAIKDWYASTAYTRLAPGGGVLVIQTRWHEDDLSGWLESQMDEDEGDTFEIVRYPAIAMEDEAYRFKDEALHPERYDEVALARIKRAVGPRVWDALYQQQPTSEEGGYFNTSMMRMYDDGDLPDEDELVFYTAWDLAIGKLERNDFSVGITVAVDIDENIWVVGLVHKRMDAYEIVESMLDLNVRYKERLVGIEKGHISMTMEPILEQRIKERKQYEFPVHLMNPGKRDKEARARAIQGRMRQGKVFFPRDAEWLGKLRKELLSFPFGKHDDIVDGLAWIGLMLLDMDSIQLEKPKKKKSWKDRLEAHLRGQTRKGVSSMAS